MASICNGLNGRKTIRLSPSERPNRPKIALGKINKRQAETVRAHLEELLRAELTGTPIPPATADWLAGIPTLLRQRLEALELTERVQKSKVPTIGQWLKTYIAGRSDVKPSTRINYKQVERNLLSYFDSGRPLDSITIGDAEDFKIYLKEKGLGISTIQRHCGRAKEFFAAAVKRDIIAKSPFADMACAVPANSERLYFVTQEEIAKVMDACPDTQWRLIFGLCRWGGLRCPSEIMPLTWADVNLEANTLTVKSPKTMHQGKGSRIVPIFPQLLPMLMDAFEQAQEGTPYLITRYRDTSANLRTQAHRIIQRAGLTPWPKTFQNLRSTRETELVERFPLHVVTAWLGNTPSVAQKHYLQVTDEHFARATKKEGPERGHDQGHNRGQTAFAGESQGLAELHAISVSRPVGKSCQNDTTPCKSKRLYRLTPRRLEQEPKTPAKTDFCETEGPRSGPQSAFEQADATTWAQPQSPHGDRLAIIADLLADLPQAERREVIADLPPEDRLTIAKMLSDGR